MKIKNDLSKLCEKIDLKFNKEKISVSDFQYTYLSDFVTDYIKNNNVSIEKLRAECYDCSAHDLLNIGTSYSAFLISALTFIVNISNQIVQNYTGKINPYANLVMIIGAAIISYIPIKAYINNRKIDQWKYYILEIIKTIDDTN